MEHRIKLSIAKKLFWESSAQRNKMSSFWKTLWSDPVYKARLSATLRGRKKRFTGKMAMVLKSPEHRAKLILVSKSPERKAKLSMAMKQLYASEQGKARRDLSSRTAVRTNRNWHTVEYLDRRGRLHQMKSSWEVKVAEQLDREKLTWEYEACTLLFLDGRRYTPDFWVSELGGYLEVKGRDRGLDKVHLARQMGHSVQVLDNIR